MDSGKEVEAGGGRTGWDAVEAMGRSVNGLFEQRTLGLISSAWLTSGRGAKWERLSGRRGASSLEVRLRTLNRRGFGRGAVAGTRMSLGLD